jgi:hypothetical protein
MMKEIKLLEQQLTKLGQKDFDLDAWKQYTVVLLSRIFGEGNPKINQIEKIEYDFSSWALRDTTGKSEYLETCKKLGREIIQASIDELKAFGLPDPDKKQEGYIPAKIIVEALEEDLKISQLRKLLVLINSDKTEEEKKKEIGSLLKSFDKTFPENFILTLLSNAQLKGKI